MSQSLYFDGKEYISSKRAAEIARYSRDYVGQLARQGVVSAKLVGRVWYVSKDDILRHALTYDLNHRNVSSVSVEEAQKILSSINSESHYDNVSGKVQKIISPSVDETPERNKKHISDFVQNGTEVMRNESQSREDMHRSFAELDNDSDRSNGSAIFDSKISSHGGVNPSNQNTVSSASENNVKKILDQFTKKHDINSPKTVLKYEDDARPLLPELSNRDSAINKAISDDKKYNKNDKFDTFGKSDEIREIVKNKKQIWADKSKRFFGEKFGSILAKSATKTTLSFAGVMVALIMIVSASYIGNNFDKISSDFRSDFSQQSVKDYSASVGTFFSDSWTQVKITANNIVCKILECKTNGGDLVKISKDDSRTTIINVNKKYDVTKDSSTAATNPQPIDLSSISDLKTQIQVLNDRLDNQKVFSSYQSDRNMENVGKTASNLYDNIVALIDQRLSSVSSGGSFSSDVTIAGILTVSGGTTSSFANSLSIGGQLTLLGTGTSTIAGDVNFDSGVLYVDSLNNRIGIGTTSPLSVLDIYGGMILSQANSYLNFGATAGTGGYGFRDNAGIIEYKTLGGSWLPVGSGGGGGADGNWTYFNGSGIRLSTSTNAVLIGANSTTTTSKLEVIGSTYISSTLGIGTTSPWRTLSVKGSSDLGNNALAGSFTATSSVSSVFPYASSTAYTISQNLYVGNLNGPLQANNGLVSATTSVGVNYGGTGVSSFGQGWIYSNGGTGTLAASTSPTVAYIYATSTTATSTVMGGLTVLGSSGLNVLQNGHVGIGTSTPVGSLYAPDLVTQAIAFPSGANITYQSGYNAYTNFSSGIGIASVPFATVNIDTPNKVALSNISTIQSGELNVRSGGTFGTKTDYTTGTLPSGIYVSDINNDGKKDVITGNNGSDNISVFPGNGDGTLGARTNYSTGTGSGPAFVIAADLNGDGFNDIVAADNASTTISVFINKKDGTFLAHVDYVSGTTPGGITINDFNGDGKSDIVVSNYGSNTISVFINNGDGTFASKVNYTVGSAPAYITSADINGDGKIDIISPNFSSNTVSVLTNNGNGTFATKVDYVTAAGPQTPTSTTSPTASCP
jgi:hypothetical protein